MQAVPLVLSCSSRHCTISQRRPMDARDVLQRHVALIGFMGAGKSTVGEEAARRIGRLFVDLDRAIEERAGDSISVIFQSWGESAFREIEEEAALEALAAREPTVI